MNKDLIRTIAVAVVVAVAASALTSVIMVNAIDHPSDNKDDFDADQYYQRIKEYADDIRKITDFRPDVAIVLGTGMGDFVEDIDVVATIPYSSLNGFPVSTAPTHTGNFVLGTVDNVKVIVMQGRIHYYEGYPMTEVVLPMRVMHELGAETVIITNATASFGGPISPGDFVAVNDHIMMAPSPFIGENTSELGPRFPSSYYIYDRELIDIAKSVTENLFESGIPVRMHEGVYLQVTGPQYESHAEARMYAGFGASTIGMSSACESLVASQMGMKVCNINAVTNIAGTSITGEEVDKTMREMIPKLTMILHGMLKEISEMNQE